MKTPSKVFEKQADILKDKIAKMLENKKMLFEEGKNSTAHSYEIRRKKQANSTISTDIESHGIKE